MDTIYAVIKGDNADEEQIRRAGDILKAGGLVAFPTETVYGLGGDALNPDSSKKIYEAKGRPSDNPLIVHICRWEDIYRIAEPVTEEVERLAEAFWPGPDHDSAEKGYGSQRNHRRTGYGGDPFPIPSGGTEAY